MSQISHWFRICGVDFKRLLAAPADLARFLRDRKEFLKKQNGDFAWACDLPILGEWSASSGELGAYFHQDLCVARWIYEANPARHVDVGSRIDGFVGHVAVFRDIDVLDVRPQPETVQGVRFHQINLMEELSADWTECTDSLSCLHTIEHFGMGRYGDPIDTNGHLKGLSQLGKLLRPGGILYLSTPIGPQRIEFNAHRIFAASSLLGWFKEGWTVEKLAYVDDLGVLHEPTDWSQKDIENHFGCKTGLGIVAVRKVSSISTQA